MPNNHETQLRNWASGQFIGKFDRRAKDIITAIATGFLFLGGIIRESMGRPDGQSVMVDPGIQSDPFAVLDEPGDGAVDAEDSVDDGASDEDLSNRETDAVEESDTDEDQYVQGTENGKEKRGPGRPRKSK